MRRNAVGRRLGGWIVLCALGAWVGTARGQTPPEAQRKFVDLRTDEIPHNCSNAVVWLYRRRVALKDAMLTELYRTDRQGRDALLQILFDTPTFVPDERFARFVINRIPEENTFVGNFDIAPGSGREPEPDAALVPPDRFGGAHWMAWRFIDQHFDLFEPLLAVQVGTKRSLWTLWGTTWIFKKHGVLAQHIALYTPDVLAWVADNLQADNVSYNASEASRIFLLLGDTGLPVLRQTAGSADAQARGFAQALLDALSGKRRAFGFLVARVNISRPLFGRGPDPPDWLEKAAEPYWDNEKTYP